MARAFSYTHQTSGVCAGVCSCDSTHQKEKSANHKMVKNTQFVGKLPTNCLSVFDHFVGLALKGLRRSVTHETTLKGSLHLVKFARANIVQVLAQEIRKMERSKIYIA